MKKKKRQLTLSSDATRRHNVRTFSCVNSLFKYLHRFICDSFFSLCVLFETVGQLESNRLGFFKEASLAASFASTAILFTLQVYRGQLSATNLCSWCGSLRVRSERYRAALPDKVSGGKANACCLSCDTFPTADKYTGRCILPTTTVLFFTEEGYNSTKTPKPAVVSGINNFKCKIPLTRRDHRARVC